MTRINRKQALKRLVAGTAAMTGLSSLTGNLHAKPLQGNINHSVCQWCYSSMPLEDLVLAAKDIGITSIDLLKADQWKVAIKHGLTCAMGYASELPLTKGFNDISLHA